MHDVGRLGRFSMEESAERQQPDSEQSAPEAARGSIPIIDLAGADGAEHDAICRQISEACETWGFFHLVNHGIDPSLLRRTKEVSLEFFHSPDEEKSKVKVEVVQGWSHSKNLVEGNKLVQRDSVEHLYAIMYPLQRKSNPYPQKPPAYMPTLLEYTNELKLLGEKLLCILSETLGLAPDALHAAAIAGTASHSLQIAMRTNFYGLNEDGEALPNLCHAHDDPGLLTFLLADDAPGLEIQHAGRWVKVDPIPGALIVNIGAVLEVCSNGRYKSVYHKGLPCSKQERLTLANFQMPAIDAVLRPNPSLLDESHPPLYKVFTFGEFFQAGVKRGLDGQRALETFRL